MMASRSHDLVSYEQKHNEANGEDNRDGADDNSSWNCGAEGPTEDAGIIELRERQKRNFWCSLMFAQGSPMISGGDELGRTQQGNNNAYCQDNELSWYHWDLDDRRKAIPGIRAARRALPQAASQFSSHAFYDNDPDAKHPDKNIVWFRADGKRMEAKDWEDGGWMRTLGMFMNGTAPEIRDARRDSAPRTPIFCCCSMHITSRSHSASRTSCTTAVGRWPSTRRGPTLEMRQRIGKAQSAGRSCARSFVAAESMSGRWIGNLPAAAARRISLECGAGILPYLAELGISHVYLSPCLQAVPGSQHGYDVVDPTQNQRRSRRRAGVVQFRERRARLGAADTARHRAESHVRLAAQSVVGRCAAARALQQLCGILRHPKFTGGSHFACTYARSRNPMARRWMRAN